MVIALLTLASAALLRDLLFDTPVISFEAKQIRKPKVQTTKWIDTNGLERSVTTTQKADESWDQMLDRHDKDVAKSLKRYPKADEK